MVVDDRILRQHLPAESFADAYSTLRVIEDKIRGRYPEAEFQLACGSDDELHLSVFTAGRSADDVMALVEDEQDSLEAKHGLFVFILPRSLEPSGA
jgi:hypothetical protein